MKIRFPDRLTVYWVTVAASALGAAVALGFSEPLPAVGALALFCLLMVFAENTAVVVPDGYKVSGSLMVSMAAVVVFYRSGSLLGPLLVGVCGGLHLPNCRARAWRKLLFNAGTVGLATLSAALAYRVFADHVNGSGWSLAALAIPAALADVIVNDTLVAGVISLQSGKPFSRVLSSFRATDLQSVPFALLGVVMGKLYLDIGGAAVPLFVVPILAARQTFASHLQVKVAQEATVRTLISALEAKDRYTSGHAERVAVYAHYMGEELNFSPRRMERLRYAALMHDIGKLIVSNRLLNKPAKLTEREFAEVRRHEEISVALLGRIDFLRPVAPSSSSRFTRYEPDGAKLPIEPHIVHVADAYDAMTSTRAYRRALSQEVAFGELRAKAGVQFHPVAVEALIAGIERREEHHGAGFEHDVHEWVVAPPDGGLGSAGLGDLAPEPHTRKRAAP